MVIMKNIIGLIILSVLVLAPIATPKAVSAAAPDAQTMLLIQLLMEKVKMLQVELAILIKAKSEPVKVEIVGKDLEYKKAVGPLVDTLENKERLRNELMIKLEQSQCLNPSRTLKGGVVTFKCQDEKPTFTSTTTILDIIPISTESEKYVKDIKALDKEITDLNLKINSLKTRYGIS